jgi:PAS domain-containing protein
MFEANIDTWRIVYGLSLFMMGTAVLARASAYPNSGFRNRLLALGIFAMLHAAGTSFRNLGLADEGAAAHVRTALYSSSYVALYYFAMGWRKSFSPVVHIVAVSTMVFWAATAGLDATQEAEILRLITSGVPAATCAALAMIRDRKFRFEYRLSVSMKWLVVAGFVAYALLHLPSAGDTLRILSVEVPVLVARSASILLVTMGTLMLLSRFDAVIRRENTEALQEAGQKLNAAMELGNRCTWEKNLTTGKVIWSKQLISLLGEDPDANPTLTGKLLDRVHEDDRTSLEAAQSDALKNLSSYDVHYRIVRPDGSIRYVQEEGSLLFRTRRQAIQNGRRTHRRHGTDRSATGGRTSEPGEVQFSGEPQP